MTGPDRGAVRVSLAASDNKRRRCRPHMRHGRQSPSGGEVFGGTNVRTDADYGGLS